MASITADRTPLLRAQRRRVWFIAFTLAIVFTSFASLDLKWSEFFSMSAMNSMGRFVAEFYPPDIAPAFLSKVGTATLETLAMSLLGTGIAAVAGLIIAVPASLQRDSGASRASIVALRTGARLILNISRSIPELVWAAMLLIAAGLGPFAGTLALAFHTTGVLGRLFADAIENAPPGPSFALRTQGASAVRVFWFATLPQIIPQVMSYTLYRWENNIRAAAVLGVVGAGGLGQLLSFHMGLFHMNKTATILSAMLALVLLVDLMSCLLRRWLTK